MNDIIKIVKYFEEFGLSIKCLTNFEIQKFIQEIINLKKGSAYIINLDEYESIGTHWIASYINDNKVTSFDNSILIELSKFQIKFKNS